MRPPAAAAKTASASNPQVAPGGRGGEQVEALDTFFFSVLPFEGPPQPPSPRPVAQIAAQRRHRLCAAPHTPHAAAQGYTGARGRRLLCVQKMSMYPHHCSAVSLSFTCSVSLPPFLRPFPFLPGRCGSPPPPLLFSLCSAPLQPRAMLRSFFRPAAGALRRYVSTCLSLSLSLSLVVRTASLLLAAAPPRLAFCPAPVPLPLLHRALRCGGRVPPEQRRQPGASLKALSFLFPFSSLAVSSSLPLALLHYGSAL